MQIVEILDWKSNTTKLFYFMKCTICKIKQVYRSIVESPLFYFIFYFMRCVILKIYPMNGSISILTSMNLNYFIFYFILWNVTNETSIGINVFINKAIHQHYFILYFILWNVPSSKYNLLMYMLRSISLNNISIILFHNYFISHN